MSVSQRKNRFLEVATPLGFEPRITPPKGAVLPLHHGVNRRRSTIFDGITELATGRRNFTARRKKLRYTCSRNHVRPKGLLPPVIRSASATEYRLSCRCRERWTAKFFHHALPQPTGRWQIPDRLRS